MTARRWAVQLLLRGAVTALGLAGRALRILGGPGARRGRVRSVLILPPAGPGSTGDEAMLAGTVAHLARSGIERIGMLSYERRPSDALARHRLVTPIPIPDYFASRGLRGLPRCAAAAARHDAFLFVGADVLDGFYSEHATRQRVRLTALAASTGARTVLGGFSFNDDASPSSVHALRRLPAGVRLRSRDALSRAELARALGRPVELTADLAFLLDPAEALPAPLSELVAWSHHERAAGSTVLGFNVNSIVCRLVPGCTPERLADACARALREVLEARADLRVLLVPHDVRGEDSDVVMARRTYERLPADLRPAARVVAEPGHAAHIKALCAALDLVVSGRMHLAIAALGVGTPALCLDYQGKVAGMFQHFGLERAAVAAEEFADPRQLARRIAAALDGREALRAQVERRAGPVRDLAATTLRFGD